MDLQPNRSDIDVLKTIKGHLGSCITNCTYLMPKVGDVTAPEEVGFANELDNCGEWAFKLALMLAFTCREFEQMTNVVRAHRGERPCDYKASASTLFIRQWQKLLKEEAPRLGFKFAEDGRLVRS